MKTKKAPLIYLEWHDACSQNGWHTDKEVTEFIESGQVIIQQSGFVIHEDKSQLILASRRDADESTGATYGMLQKIPKTWVKKRIRMDKHIG